MADFATNPKLLQYQYGTAEKLRIRQEAHELYSEDRTDYFAWILEFLALAPGIVVADVGCGPGAYHPLLAPLGCQAIGIDYSQGMLEEVRSQAQQQHLAVWAVRADAQHLPLATGCCDRLMANHMLYHVPDQRAALHEMRRVVRPGGIVVLATNAEDAGGLLYDAHCAAAVEFGYQPSARPTAGFHLGHLARVQEVFPNATMHVRSDAFLFPTVDAALRYYASGMIDALEDAPPDGSHRQPLLTAVAARLQPIHAQAGVLLVAKDAGCFVARVEARYHAGTIDNLTAD